MKKLHVIAIGSLVFLLFLSACAGWAVSLYQTHRLTTEQRQHRVSVDTATIKANLLNKAFRDCIARAAKETHELDACSVAMRCLIEYKDRVKR